MSPFSFPKPNGKKPKWRLSFVEVRPGKCLALQRPSWPRLKTKILLVNFGIFLTRKEDVISPFVLSKESNKRLHPLSGCRVLKETNIWPTLKVIMLRRLSRPPVLLPPSLTRVKILSLLLIFKGSLKSANVRQHYRKEPETPISCIATHSINLTPEAKLFLNLPPHCSGDWLGELDLDIPPCVACGCGQNTVQHWTTWCISSIDKLHGVRSSLFLLPKQLYFWATTILGLFTSCLIAFNRQFYLMPFASQRLRIFPKTSWTGFHRCAQICQGGWFHLCSTFGICWNCSWIRRTLASNSSWIRWTRLVLNLLHDVWSHNIHTTIYGY